MLKLNRGCFLPYPFFLRLRFGELFESRIHVSKYTGGAAKGKRVKGKRLIVLGKAEAQTAAAKGTAKVPGVAVPTAAANHAGGTACWA